MSDPYLGELKLVSFNFAPKGWAMCNGQFMAINQNQATFALLDLRGRAALHFGGGFTQGQAGGQEAHTVTMSELPQHNHFVHASSSGGDAADPGTLAQFS